MNAAMNIGVVRLVVPGDGIDHSTRLLRGRGIVQIDQRLAVHLLEQDRKIRPDLLRVVRAQRRLSRGDVQGLMLCAYSHWSSPSRWGLAALVASVLICAIWLTRLSMSGCTKARTALSFMRSVHSLAKARSSIWRAETSSMPRVRR